MRPRVDAPLLAATVLLGAFALLTLATEPGGSRTLDSALARLADQFIQGPLHWLVDSVERFGAPEISVLLAALLAGALLLRGRWLAAALVIAALAALTLIESFLRVRLEAVPWQDVPDLLAQPRGRGLMKSGYPSGHTARLVLLAGVAAVLLPRRWLVPGIVAAAVCGVLIAAQRVHGRTHTGTEVAGGYLLGAGLASLVAAVLPWTTTLERWAHARWSRQERTAPFPAGASTASAGLPAAVARLRRALAAAVAIVTAVAVVVALWNLVAVPRTLDLARRSNSAAWLVAALFGAAAVAAVLLWALDEEWRWFGAGRWVWLVAAGGLIWLSVDAVAGLQVAELPRLVNHWVNEVRPLVGQRIDGDEVPPVSAPITALVALALVAAVPRLVRQPRALAPALAGLLALAIAALWQWQRLVVFPGGQPAPRDLMIAIDLARLSGALLLLWAFMLRLRLLLGANG